MLIDFEKLPKKARRRRSDLVTILCNADDKLYSITKVDYNTGMILFESLLSERTLISLYVSTGTLLIFDKISRKSKYCRRLSVEEINKKFNENQDKR